MIIGFTPQLVLRSNELINITHFRKCLAHLLLSFIVQTLKENEVAQSCPTLWDPMDCSPTRLLRPWDFPGKNTGVGCHFLLQEIFLTQGLNPGLLHCRQTLYHLSHREVVQTLSRVQLFVTPCTAAHQVSLSFTISHSLLRLMSIESMMLSNHFALFRPLLLLPQPFPASSLESNKN